MTKTKLDQHFEKLPIVGDSAGWGNFAERYAAHEDQHARDRLTAERTAAEVRTLIENDGDLTSIDLADPIVDAALSAEQKLRIACEQAAETEKGSK